MDTKSNIKEDNQCNFKSHEFAKSLINQYHIIRLNENQLHLYVHGIYVSNDYGIIEDLILNIKPFLSTRTVTDIMYYIQHKAPKRKSISSAEYIAYNNGVLNLRTLELEPFDPDKFILTTKIDIDYVNPDDVINNEDNIAFVDKYFNDLTLKDEELIKLLYEIIRGKLL